jgi:hypothetical protein
MREVLCVISVLSTVAAGCGLVSTFVVPYRDDDTVRRFLGVVIVVGIVVWAFTIR